MKLKWQKLAGELLALASEEFGSHCCNDWKWPKDWTPEDREEFSRAIVADNVQAIRKEPSAEDERDAAELAAGNYGPSDWWVMVFLGKELQRE